MGTLDARVIQDRQGGLQQTNGTFDLAIEGEGFFLISTPEGEQITRAGAFSPGSDGTLRTLEGHQVLDGAGSPIFVPSEIGGIEISSDGTISASGEPIGQIGLYVPNDPLDLQRSGGVRFASGSGFQPFQDGKILQGFIEGSNVDPVAEIARMIEVQRTYELGQSFLDQEDQRIKSVISSLGRT